MVCGLRVSGVGGTSCVDGVRGDSYVGGMGHVSSVRCGQLSGWCEWTSEWVV